MDLSREALSRDLVGMPAKTSISETEERELMESKKDYIILAKRLNIRGYKEITQVFRKGEGFEDFPRVRANIKSNGLAKIFISTGKSRIAEKILEGQDDNFIKIYEICDNKLKEMEYM